MATLIHPTAVVDPRAQLADGVEVGPYAVVGPDVEIGAGCWIGPHVVLDGRVRLGRGNRIFPGACIGLEPQDLKYTGDPTEVVLGDDNTIRECVTINRATTGNQQTRLGSGNLLMAYTHLGHNCELGDRIVIANGVAVAGHVVIGERAVIGGVLGIHQFVHIGTLAMVGGMSRIDRDCPPFMMIEGHPGRVRGLNRVGLRRSGQKLDVPHLRSGSESGEQTSAVGSRRAGNGIPTNFPGTEGGHGLGPHPNFLSQ